MGKDFNVLDLLIDFLANYYGPTPYLIVFAILLACGLGLPIPEDITLFAAGVACYYGLTDPTTMIIVCMVGVLLGDSIIFWLGAKFGRKLTKKWIFHKLLPDDRLDAMRIKLKERGNKLIFSARFMPGLRAPVYFSCGTLHVPYKVFLFYDGTAALISVPAIVGLVYYFGDQLDHVIKIIQRVEHGIAFLVFSLIFLAIGKFYYSHLKKKRLENQKGGKDSK